MRIGRRLAIVVCAAATLAQAASPSGAAAGGPAGRARELRLRAASFDPVLESAERAARALPEPIRSLRPPDDLFLIQFDGPPLPAWLGRLREAGVTIFDYLPEDSYLVRVPAPAIGRVAGEPFVRALVPYQPAFRMDPELLHTGPPRAGGRARLLVQAAPDLDPARLAAALAAAAPGSARLGGGRHPGASLVEIEVGEEVLPSLLPRLASLKDVFWIEERRPIVPDNDAMKWVLQTGLRSSTRLFSKGLTGSGQVIGESDTGADVSHCFFDDPSQEVTFELVDPDNPPAVPLTNPLHRKVLAYQRHAASSTVDESGHGTHVAGTAVGDDLAHAAAGTDPGLDLFDGMAPAARLVFQDIDQPGGSLEVPVNLYGFVQAAYNAGARIHTNSWGGDTSDYTSEASQVDRFSWDHPDMLFFFAAGNDGPNAGSINAPATAKNVVAVGMVETPTAGDPNNLEAGSANGPTSDGRRKPEVVNVGGFPIRSADAGTACGILAAGGTSMSTPGAAGGAGLLRQFFSDGFLPHGYAGSGPGLVPSAALLKAAVINSAVNIAGTNVDAPIPDNSQGWGRVLLDNAAFFPGDPRRLAVLRDDDLASTTDGFAVGATAADSYQVFSCRADVPLKVTLVWTEPPVAATSGQAWVNDLNLEVVAPGGARYLGNVLSGGVSVTGGSPDDRNNVEQVLLAGGVASGSYTVRVVPAEVAVGPQPYALLVTGDVSASPIPRLTVIASARGGGCDGDAFLDDGETLEVSYTVRNDGCAEAGPSEASLVATTSLPVGIAPASLPLPALPVGTTTTFAFHVSLGDTGGLCGGDIPLLLRIQAADGERWELAETQLLRLDPAAGARAVLDDVESGDRSVAKDLAWQIGSCQTASPTRAWHMGQADCSGIPRDASSHGLTFEVGLGPGEELASASFVHAFNGYSNASFTDAVHFEIDHDLDGSFDAVASFLDGAAPTAMTPAGPFDLSSFNPGRASTVRFRFRFQSAALWVGPDTAPGWNVDDFRVGIRIVAVCDVNSKSPPGNVGDTLRLDTSGADLLLSWNAAPGAASYRVLRSQSPEFSATEAFAATSPSLVETGGLLDPRTFFYKVLAVSTCGVVSAD